MTMVAQRVCRVLAMGALVLLVGATGALVMSDRDATAGGSPAAAPARPAAVGQVAPASPVWQTIASGGLQRRYLLSAPGGTGPHPLIVLLHGLDQQVEPFSAATGILQVAAAQGVVVAVPETPDGSWNDGRLGPNGRDDAAFLAAMVDQLARERVADPDRVTLVGFSNGATMSAALSSAYPDLAAGLVLVAGELLGDPGSARPTRPVETVLIHGDEDPIQPWRGRPRRSPRLPPMIGVPATAEIYAQLAGDTDGPIETVLPHRPDVIPVTRQVWNGADSDVTLYRLNGGAHTWPVLSCPGTACVVKKTFVHRGDISATQIAVELATTAVRPGAARVRP